MRSSPVAAGRIASDAGDIREIDFEMPAVGWLRIVRREWRTGICNVQRQRGEHECDRHFGHDGYVRHTTAPFAALFRIS